MFHHTRSVRNHHAPSHRLTLRHEPLEERRLLDGGGVQIEIEGVGEQIAPVEVSSLPVDWDGIGGFDRTTGLFHLKNIDIEIDEVTPFVYGGSGFVGLAGDWNQDAIDSVGVYDAINSSFYLRNSNDSGVADAGQFTFGRPGSVPLAGDWNFDLLDSVGVYVSETSSFYLRNSNDSGIADAGQFTFGRPGWVPLVGDWNADGYDGIGMYDPETATFYLRNSLSAGAPDIEPFQYGLQGWKPIAGDWNGDGIDTIGAFNPDTTTFFLRNSNSTGVADITPFNHGSIGSDPIVGDWNVIISTASELAPSHLTEQVPNLDLAALTVTSDVSTDIVQPDGLAPTSATDSSLKLAEPTSTPSSIPTFSGAAVFMSSVVDEVHTVDLDLSDDLLIDQLAIDQFSERV